MRLDSKLNITGTFLLRALTAEVSQWKRCSLLTVIGFHTRKNVAFVLSTYADCISKGPWDLRYAKGLKHTIDTGSA